jgi:hypothetical protein
MHEREYGSVPRKGWARLWATVQPLGEPHAVIPEGLGEYASLWRRHGPEAAARAFPGIAAHLDEACPTCTAELAELVSLLDADHDERESPWLDAVQRQVQRARVPGLGANAGEIVVAVEFMIPRYPELLLRVSREYNGSLAQLIVLEEARETALDLGGWEVQVKPAATDTRFHGATTTAGTVRLAWLPLEMLTDARVAVRPPAATSGR